MSVGQELLDVPIADMVRDLAAAVAEGQLSLDRASIETLKVSMGLKGNVTAEQVFDASFLPAKEERMLP